MKGIQEFFDSSCNFSINLKQSQNKKLKENILPLIISLAFHVEVKSEGLITSLFYKCG